MRIIRAFQANDNSVHLSPEACARHDFELEMRQAFAAEPTIAELSINMDQVLRIIEKSKSIDTSVQRLTA